MVITQTIRRAVEKHNAELAKVLNGRELRFIIQTEDFPIVRKCVWLLLLHDQYEVV